MLLLLTSLAMAEDAWTTQEVDLVRWPGATDDNPVVDHVGLDEKVEIVFRDGERVRVRTGGYFGWCDAAALTDVSPLPGTGLLDGLGLEGLSLEGLGLPALPPAGVPKPPGL